MKITVNKDITGTVQDILLVILLAMCIFFVYDNECLKKENEEIKERYNIVQEEKVEIMKLLKESVEQDSTTNNLETRY